MQAKRVHWDRLPKGSTERAIARIAHVANINTHLGGCSALVKAKRAESMGLPHAYEMRDAVDETYARSSGHASAEHSAWECNECGQVHLGIAAASECCAECFADCDD